MADSGALQQHSSWQAVASGIDAQEADASAVTSDAPRNTAKAIQEKRRLVKVIAMVHSGSGTLSPVGGAGQFILGAQSVGDKRNVSMERSLFA